MTDAPSPWQLSGANAQLRLRALSGALDIERPFAGVAVSLGQATLRLFRVELPPPQSGSSEAPEFYIRGRDLVASYMQDQRNIRAQVYWRAFECGPDRAPAIDLIVSVQTGLLDSDPTLHVRSQIAASQVVNLHGPDLLRDEDITPRGSDSHVVKYEGKGPACWLFRLREADTTYVEMVHPADFVGSRFQEIGPGEIEHRTKLFRGPLEKGVILRSRMRGVVVPRGGDAAAAAACYREFAVSEPPLTA